MNHPHRIAFGIGDHREGQVRRGYDWNAHRRAQFLRLRQRSRKIIDFDVENQLGLAFRLVANAAGHTRAFSNVVDLTVGQPAPAMRRAIDQPNSRE